MAASQPRLVGGRCPVILRQASTTGVADEADEDQPIDGDPRRGRLLSVAELRRALQLTREGLAAPTRLAPSPREPRTFQGGPGLPLRVVDDDAAAGWVVGASGGSGESLLAELLNGDGGDRYAAAGHHWPAAAAGGPIRVVLCGRTDMRSLTDVQLALAQWGTGRLPAVNLVGMVLMADAPGRAPRRSRSSSKFSPADHHACGGSRGSGSGGWGRRRTQPRFPSRSRPSSPTSARRSPTTTEHRSS